MTKPCDSTCPKCGSSNIRSCFKLKGVVERICYRDSDKPIYKPSKYVRIKDSILIHAVDHLEYHCKFCHYGWRGDTL